MIRFAADEDFNHHVVRALRRSLSTIDIVSVQEAGHRGRPVWKSPRVAGAICAAAAARLCRRRVRMYLEQLSNSLLDKFGAGEPIPLGRRCTKVK